MEPTATTSDPTHRANGSEYFTHDEEMIYHGSIISGSAVFGSDPESVRTFTDSFITGRLLIWDKMFAIFQALDACTYMKPANNIFDRRMEYKLV